MRVTGSLVIIWTRFAAFMIIIFQARFAQDAHEHRRTRLFDAAMTNLSNGFRLATWIPAFGGGICMWLEGTRRRS
jgi:hypothetical protein